VTKEIILDTDIGTDVDDAFAVALAARSPELNVKAVTVVWGDVDLRARIARKLLNLAGREDIPVAKGLGKPLTPGVEARMNGFEGKDFLEESDVNLKIHEKSAVDLIIENIMESDDVIMVTIGPLTNFAAAIIKEPKIVKKISEYVLMGGAINPPIIKGKTISPRLETNLNSDPEATKIVLRSGIPTKMVVMDVTWRVLIGRNYLQRLRNAKTPLANALADMLEVWLSLIGEYSEEIFGYKYVTAMHDPLALSAIIDPRFLTFKEMHIELETIDGILRTIPKTNLKPNMKVAVDVDVQGFLDFLMKRLL